LEFGPALALDHRVGADVALGLEHFEHALAQLRVRARHLALVAHLRVADARQQIAERIVHGHRATLLTSSTSPGPESAPSSRVREARCATACACDKSRAAVR